MNMCIVFIAVFGNVHDDCLRSAVYYLRTVFGGLGAIFAESFNVLVAVQGKISGHGLLNMTALCLTLGWVYEFILVCAET